MTFQKTGLTICLLALSLVTATAQNRASFDCAKAKEDIEKAICKSAVLSRHDRDIAAAYADARKRLDPVAQAALKDDQELFLVGREIAMIERGGNLADFMKTRLELLRSLEAGPTGMGAAAFIGEWKNENGSILFVAGKNGEVTMKVSSAAMVTAKWVCEFEKSVLVRAGTISFKEEKVRIDIVRAGSALKVSETSPPDDHQKPYCGHSGGIEGHYFKVK
ncbi:MAG: hypothetical protein ACRCWF_12655 [Beijerinckiaceae bacterium]